MPKKQFKAESKRLLDMMINSIYTHREIFLREIISNASDALDKLCYKAMTQGDTGFSRADLFIDVTPDKEDGELTISDNGVGMTKEELEENLGVIARSGSGAFKGNVEGEAAEDIDIIGQFGVGFYSAFMVADKVQVITRAYGSEEAFCWESTGADGYTIKPCLRAEVGTDVVLHIRPDTEEEKYSQYLDETHIRSLIKKYSDYIRYPIKIEDETINSMVPIWQRSRAEADDAACAKFYQDTFHDPEAPVRIIRVNAEGSVSYKAVLFIPARAPYDFYTKEYKAGLQLYSSGVLIMENCADLLPDYFRFVKGVVDSPDLSLNISRELLQHDRQLKTIAVNLEKRIKNELQKLLETERETYERFWNSFGLQLKYAAVGNFGANKDKLQDLLLFWSSREGKLETLAEYVAAMPEGQKAIYYACGESVSKLDQLPQAERVKDKGYAILYLTEDVDEFVMNTLGSYAEKPLQSVNDDDLDLGDESDEKAVADKEEKCKDMLDFIRERLDGQVAAVKLSRKLKSHPVCLSTQGGVTLEMEKFFAQMPGQTEKIRAERVLELNAGHPVFAALELAFAQDKDKCARYAQLLLDQALLIAGLPLENPSAFAERVCALMV